MNTTANRTMVRLVTLIPTVLLGSLIFSFFHGAWVNFHLMQNAQQTKALITKEHAHGVVDYKYTVEGKEYDGKGQRNWDLGIYRNVTVGEESIVYFSTSHPWMSSLEMPRVLITAWPVLLIALGMELFLVMTVINPKGKWALKTGV
ncbi:hypothetical protein SBV1_1770021 [Verrucomicrobia bacterium]|nr:hypothetical protein SBV1_1770021 [Verrucomicrobiota bacterium]